MDASNLWGQHRTAHLLLLQQQGHLTPQQQQALLEQHHRHAIQQQAQRQAMAALSMQYGQPATWGMTMPQQCSSAQTANQATGGVTQAQQPSAMDATMTQPVGTMHTVPMRSPQHSAQQVFPNPAHLSFPAHTIHPFAHLLTPHQQQATPTLNMTTTPSNPQSTTTTAEALSLTHLAQNMDPVARRQLIQLVASHEPTTTSPGGSAAVTQQQLQPPHQPSSQHTQPPQTQTHVPTATTDATAVDAPRSEPKAPPSTRTRPDSLSPRREHHRSRRSRTQRRHSRASHSDSPTYRHRRQHRRRSSTSSRRPRKHQHVHPQRSGRRPTSPRRSRSTRHSRPGERSPPTVPVKLRSRSQLGLDAFTTPAESKWQWRRADISPQTKRKPQPPRTIEQLSAQFIRMARQQTLQAHRSSASGHATSRQPPTPPPGRRTSTPPQRTHEQLDLDEEDAEQSAQSTSKQYKHHNIPASRILPPHHKPAPVSQQRFWRATVPKPFCQLRDAEKPRPLSYEVASANQFAQTLEELTEGTGLSIDDIQAFSRMIHEAGLQDRTDVLPTTVLDIGQGVYKVVFIPIDLGTAPLAFGQHPDEARGSVWSYVAAHGTDKEGMRGILLDKSSEDLSISNMQEITPVAVYGAATPGTWGEFGVLDNLLRKPKRVQGWIAIGTLAALPPGVQEHSQGT